MLHESFRKYWLPVIAWSVVILAITITPGPALAPVSKIPFSSVLAHFGEFLVFSFLLHRALASEKLSPRNALILTVLISFAYSSMTEILQLFVPGRFFDYGDMLTNDIGVIAGLGRSIYALVAY